MFNEASCYKQHEFKATLSYNWALAIGEMAKVQYKAKNPK